MSEVRVINWQDYFTEKETFQSSSFNLPLAVEARYKVPKEAPFDGNEVLVYWSQLWYTARFDSSSYTWLVKDTDAKWNLQDGELTADFDEVIYWVPLPELPDEGVEPLLDRIHTAGGPVTDDRRLVLDSDLYWSMSDEEWNEHDSSLVIHALKLDVIAYGYLYRTAAESGRFRVWIFDSDGDEVGSASHENDEAVAWCLAWLNANEKERGKKVENVFDFFGSSGDLFVGVHMADGETVYEEEIDEKEAYIIESSDGRLIVEAIYGRHSPCWTIGVGLADEGEIIPASWKFSYRTTINDYSVVLRISGLPADAKLRKL